jgi:hypothetical protein
MQEVQIIYIYGYTSKMPVTYWYTGSHNGLHTVTKNTTFDCMHRNSTIYSETNSAITSQRYPNSGLIITGDFNRLNVDSVKCHFKLKQLVKQPTRESAILDLFLTNLDKFYQDASLASPLVCQTTTQYLSVLANERGVSLWGSVLSRLIWEPAVANL